MRIISTESFYKLNSFLNIVTESFFKCIQEFVIVREVVHEVEVFVRTEKEDEKVM